MTHEEVPLAVVFREVLAFLAERDDAVLFGAQGVNAYCEPARMTADVDVLSTNAAELAGALREHLASKVHIAVRVREVVAGVGFRIYQVRKPKNRHLVDVRQVEALPDSRRIERVQVATPVELLVLKVKSIVARRGHEKELSDRLDVARLLRTFPKLRAEQGPVSERLAEQERSQELLGAWRELLAQHFAPDDEDDGY